MRNFNYWKELHDSHNLEEFNTNSLGLLWLKVKSIVRKELIKEFVKKNEINLKERNLSQQFIELYILLCKYPIDSHKRLDLFIRQVSSNELNNFDTEQLVSELYELKNYAWGGDYKNSLDKYLVSKYVKTNKSFNTLLLKLEEEISGVVSSYVLNSWYNHWSSVLIEHIFKSHNIVLPTVGQIKGVDFFINDIPFDLKVTYLPVEYIRYKRKEKGYPVELTFLKEKARELSISFDSKKKDTSIYYEIVEKIKDRNDKLSLSVLETLKSQNLQILKEAELNSKLLSTWLYENQGEMRFGSENRLFLVLIDTEDFKLSWKLKRNIKLLKPAIINYLDNFRNKQVEELKITFNYKKPYNALTDVIFIKR